MSWFAKLFGSSAGEPPEPELYKDFLIFAEPVKEASGFRIAARIEKEIEGELKSHLMIRADTYSSEDTAVEASLTKAKQFIDQVGDGVFRY